MKALELTLSPRLAIVEDARHPQKYRMLVQMVDVIFADVAQPDQARIIALNAHHFLKNGGAIVISIKANCIDSTAPATQVFASEVNNMRKEGIKPKGELSERGERDSASRFLFTTSVFSLILELLTIPRSLC